MRAVLMDGHKMTRENMINNCFIARTFLSERYLRLPAELIEEFSDIKQAYIEQEEWYKKDLSTLPHIIFGDLFNPWLISLLKNERGNKDELQHAFAYLEKLANDEDADVQNVIQVTVMEQLGDDKKILRKSYKYMGKRTRQLSDLAEKMIGRS